VTAIDRLRRQVDDLTVRFIDEDVDERPLMDQLRYLGPHISIRLGIVGKTQPASKPPGNLAARQLYDRIISEALSWAWTLGGARIRPDRALPVLPVLAQNRVDSSSTEKQTLLHGRGGLYSTVAEWHMSSRVMLGYDRPADRYPTATCPHCAYRDKHGGSIRAREALAWCSNPDCRDEQGRRHEWSTLALRDMLREAVEVVNVR